MSGSGPIPVVAGSVLIWTHRFSNSYALQYAGHLSLAGSASPAPETAACRLSNQYSIDRAGIGWLLSALSDLTHRAHVTRLSLE
jgi:hypothetical protein